METSEEKQYVLGLFPLLHSIGEETLREQVIRVWLRLWHESDFTHIEEVPWAVAYQDQISLSNVEHTNQVAKCALAMAKMAQEVLHIPVNIDYLLAGAFLIDGDKIVLNHANTLAPTQKRQYFAHGFYTAHIALEEGMPPEIAHMILSHSKGSNLPPTSVEAIILHYSDYLVGDLRFKQHHVDYLFAAEAPKFARVFR